MSNYTIADGPYIEVVINFYRDFTGVTKESFWIYKDMVRWLEETCPGEYHFTWIDKAKFLPNAVRLLPETATAFRLKYDI